MIFEIVGVIHEIGALQTFPAKDGTQFVKQQVILDKSRTDEDTHRLYENFPVFEFAQKQCQQLTGFSKGHCVKIRFDINGRRYNDAKTGQERYFTTLKGISIEPYNPYAKEPTSPYAKQEEEIRNQPAPTYAPPQQASNTDEEVLPF